MIKKFLIKPTSKSFEKSTIYDRTLLSFSVKPFDFRGKEITHIVFNNLDDTNNPFAGFRQDLLERKPSAFLLLSLEENDLEVEEKEKWGIKVTNLVCRSEMARGNWYVNKKDLTFRPVPNEKVIETENG